jgi:hypothetical protein
VATATRPTSFVEGRDYPSPVVQIIGFGYYDGVTDGVLKTADGAVYVFDMAGEEYNPDGLDRRTFELAPLPASTFERLVPLLESHATPSWPCWLPVWTFPSEEARAAVESQIDRLLADAGKPTWRVESHDLLETVSATRLT